jgi:hypothetical protein
MKMMENAIRHSKIINAGGVIWGYVIGAALHLTSGELVQSLGRIMYRHS